MKSIMEEGPCCDYFSQQWKEHARKYREAHRDIRLQLEALQASSEADKAAALAAQNDEIMLLRAQIRAREEEVAALKGAAQNAQTKIADLRNINAQFVLEVRRLNSHLSGEIAWKNHKYEVALRLLAEKMDEQAAELVRLRSERKNQ
jgi:hypothetical protein